VTGGVDYSRRDGVTADAVRSKFPGEAFGEGDQAAFGRAVRRRAWAASITAGDRNHRFTITPDLRVIIDGHHRLRTQHRALQVEVENVVPLRAVTS